MTSFTYDGGRRTGAYEVRSGMVHVTTDFGTKSTQVGGSPPLAIARMLAGELMREAKTTEMAEGRGSHRALRST